MLSALWAFIVQHFRIRELEDALESIRAVPRVRFALISSDVRADWFTVEGQDSLRWYPLAGGSQRLECDALCQTAGKMLVLSPRVAASLSDEVRSWTDPSIRWLQFLKGRYAGISGDTFAFDNVYEDGSRSTTFSGQIQDVGRQSKLACLSCAAEET
jgi:hypothetical protein